MTQAFALALLASVPGLGYAGMDRLLAAAGSAQEALEHPRAYAQALGPAELHALEEGLRGADALQRTLEREGVRLIARGEAGYPPLLGQIAKPPHVLFVKGEANLTDAFPVAVVGTRHSDEYGLRQTRKIARELAEAGVCVVSGLALGVDAAAHTGALDAGGRTVAVLGGALDKFYPPENLPLAERILETGGSIVSEFAMGMLPTRYSFLQRNRIIAGMSLGVLVTRGPERSGAKRTACDALDEGREVFALPGNADNALSALPNRLLAEGAHLAVCGGDILGALVIEPPRKTKKARKRSAPAGSAQEEESAPLSQDVDEEESAVLAALADGEADFDALCVKTGIPAQELGATLSMMELDGLIDALPGLRYRRAQ